MRLRIPRVPRVPRIRHARTVAEIVGAVLLLSGGAASAAVIMPAATTTTIHGCENTKTGALSVRVHATCPAGTKAISWNVTGPVGPRGPVGPAGTTGIFGTSTNAAIAGTGGTQCTLGQVILTAGTHTAMGTIPANGQLLSISQNVKPAFQLGVAVGARHRG